MALVSFLRRNARGKILVIMGDVECTLKVTEQDHEGTTLECVSAADGDVRVRLEFSREETQWLGIVVKSGEQEAFGVGEEPTDRFVTTEDVIDLGVFDLPETKK